MLCEELVKRDHDVTVITGVPHYPSGQVPPEYRGQLVSHAKENGVEVVRVALPSVDRSNLAARFLQFLVFQMGAIGVGWRRSYDVLLTHSAAFEVGLPFAYFSVLRSKPAVYSVHDVYPDVAVKMGIFKHPVVIKLVAALERFCLHHASQIRILSKSFSSSLLKKGVPESKIHLIYDWVETDKIKPLPRKNDFAVKNELVDHFVVLYAGNIGPAQGLESVIEAARLLQHKRNIRFVFVGEGKSRDELMEKAHDLKLSNVQFIPYQPRERMPEIWASADVSLVCLKKGVGFGALPSKTYSILASGRPVVVSVDQGSDTWQLIEQAEAGICVPPENATEIAAAIQTLEKDKVLCKRLGEKGRDYALRNHSPGAAAEQFERLLKESLEGTGAKALA